jgi:hypothetical protein
MYSAVAFRANPSGLCGVPHQTTSPRGQMQAGATLGRRNTVTNSGRGGGGYGTMMTGVPTSTISKSSSLCGMCMRMHPCDAAVPME